MKFIPCSICLYLKPPKIQILLFQPFSYNGFSPFWIFLIRLIRHFGKVLVIVVTATGGEADAHAQSNEHPKQVFDCFHFNVLLDCAFMIGFIPNGIF